jgi:hypothetical protein
MTTLLRFNFLVYAYIANHAKYFPSINTKKHLENKLDKNLKATYKFKHIPVKHVVVGKALSVEQGPEHLPQIVVVRTLFEPQGSAVIQICGEFS